MTVEGDMLGTSAKLQFAAYIPPADNSSNHPEGAMPLNLAAKLNYFTDGTAHTIMANEWIDNTIWSSWIFPTCVLTVGMPDFWATGGIMGLKATCPVICGYPNDGGPNYTRQPQAPGPFCTAPKEYVPEKYGTANTNTTYLNFLTYLPVDWSKQNIAKPKNLQWKNAWMRVSGTYAPTTSVSPEWRPGFDWNTFKIPWGS